MDLRQIPRSSSVLSWVKNYIGIPFTPYNCAAFVEKILKEQFNCPLKFPQTTHNRSRDIDLIKQEICKLKKTDNPQDGDVVLMDGYREACHVGVYLNVNNVPSVLHSDVTMKTSVLHKISDISKYRYYLNGFYTWRK